MAGIAEDWGWYSTRDKILLCSSILPLFVSVIYALYYTPIIGWILWGTGVFSEGGIFSIVDYAEGCVDSWECGRVYYIINPLWLLLSSISIGIYGFYLFRGAPSSSPSALFRTTFILTFAAISQIVILIFNSLFTWGSLSELPRGVNWVSDYYGAPPPIIPFAYLYLPNLIATVALAYYSRIKNVEENADYIEREDKALTGTDAETGYEGESPVVQSHIFLLVTALGGMFGLDKAYRGDYLLAILKFITLGGLWIWQLYDLYVAAGIAGKSWVAEKLRTGRITEAHVALWIAASPLGFIGVDRAYKGDALSGVFKMLTLGGLGLWWLADAYVAAKKAGSAW